jgi:hypothetical protein
MVKMSVLAGSPSAWKKSPSQSFNFGKNRCAVSHVMTLNSSSEQFLTSAAISAMFRT